jgi:hypothetical protein
MSRIYFSLAIEGSGRVSFSMPLEMVLDAAAPVLAHRLAPAMAYAQRLVRQNYVRPEIPTDPFVPGDATVTIE